MAPGGIVYIGEIADIRMLVPIPLDEPVIGVVGSGAWLSGTISPGALISVTGANLSASTRTWTSEDFVGNLLPLSLDGVSVTVDGKQAAVSYISPGQINAQCPDVLATGTSKTVSVQVVSQGHASNALTTNVLPVAPALFAVQSPVSSGIRYAAAVHSDGALVGQPGDWGLPSTRPAVGGEVISVFGTGFGPSIPPIPAGTMPTMAEPLAGSVEITMGNDPVPVKYAGIVGPGLVQLNFVVPNEPVLGVVPIFVSVSGVYQPPNQTLYLAVGPN